MTRLSDGRPPNKRAALERIILSISGVVTVLFCPWPTWAGPPAASPPAPSRLTVLSLCKPIFVIDKVAHQNGTGFLLELRRPKRKTYLFTAQHLISIPPAEISSRVTSAKCVRPASEHVVTTGAAIVIPGAHAMGALKDLRDVAVFPVKGWSPALPLATVDVGPNQFVWLLAQVKSGREKDLLLHRAVVGRSDGFLAYRFDDEDIGLDQTSGAPVVNAAGEVVGLNVGYTRLPDGHLIGVGDRLSTLQSVADSLP